MSDFISRQEAIDALDVGAELLRRVLDETDIVGAEREKYKLGLGLIESCISDMEELPTAQPEQQWIPVSERLPEEGQEVLVSCCTTGNKRVIISRYQGEQCGFTCGLVSAWMPLPKLYKSESEA